MDSMKIHVCWLLCWFFLFIYICKKKEWLLAISFLHIVTNEQMSDEISKLYIENLPNELWIEVFKYFDWMNLFSAFYGINKRINQLLMSIKVLSIYSSCLINYHHQIYLYFRVNFISKFNLSEKQFFFS